MDQYLSVAVGAWAGMMWPFVIKLLKRLAPDIALRTVFPPRRVEAARKGKNQNAILRYGVWVLMTLVVAAAVAALNIVPLVVGDQAKELQKLGGWQYFFLGTEGFALAAFINEGIRPK